VSRHDFASLLIKPYKATSEIGAKSPVKCVGRGRGLAAPLRHSDATNGGRDGGGAAVRVARQRVNCTVTRAKPGERETFSLREGGRVRHGERLLIGEAEKKKKQTGNCWVRVRVPMARKSRQGRWRRREGGTGQESADQQ
jgi:hypothetical protein